MIVSPSVSLVAAGVASGLCFILFSTLRKGKEADTRRKTKEIVVTDDGRCACCLKPFLIGRGVSCNDCGLRSCRKVCSRWDCEDNAWHCLFCHQQRSWARKKEKWFETFGGTFKEEELHRYFDTAKSRVYVAGVENAATGSGLDLAAGGQEDANTMETVRAFIEKIIEDLIGNVDDASIARLYDHPEYDRLLATYSVKLADALARLAVSVHLNISNKPSTDSPTMAHSALRELVGRAVEEAKKLPGLSDSSADNSRTHDECNISEHSYENLLATAILNKVIEKFQKEQIDGNSNVLHEKPSAKAESETELGLDEGVEEGSSSLEPLSQDECSSDCSIKVRARHSRNRQEPLSLTIEERIEEVTTTYTSDEDPPECVKNGLHITNVRRVPFPELGMDIIDPSQESSDESQNEEDESTAHVDLVAPFQSWEENWLFQKKRVPIQSDPVAMLVPSSSADFKALIGDKDAEDTSDLSECSSAQSDEEIEKELLEAINNVVPRSPRISECEFVESFNENETNVRKDIQDFHSMNKNYEFIETSLDYQKKTIQLSNGDVKCTENINIGKNEIIQKDKKHLMYSLNNNNNNIEKKDMNYNIEINDEKFDTRSEYEHVVDSKTEIQRTDIRLLQSQKDTSPDVPKIPTQSTKSSMLENNLQVIPNDVVGLNKKVNLKSLGDIQNKIIDQDINGEEDKTTLYSLNVYSKEEVHFEDEAQQESEYTEHYDTATQRHLDSLTKDDFYVLQNDEVLETTVNDIELTSNLSSKEETYNGREAVANVKVDSVSYSSLEETAEKDIQLSTPPRPGTIAEREHKKWENAPPIENNPYSEKSIKKRLLERQYSRRSADMPGMNTELPLSNGTDLVLEPNQPDIKRFGRDYYINNGKSATGEKIRKSPTTSATSRPDSALSQRSNSTTGTDQEQQNEESFDKDMAYDSPKSRTEKWRRNNSNSSTEESTKDEYTEKKKNDVSPMKRQKSWNDQKVEDLLENERKNSKNEINARLNNQDNNCGIFETQKSYIQSDNQKMIRRIDLKAYGFENDFDSNKKENVKSTRPQRVVNKLDLKSFGYDGGLRRTQSHNQINGVDIKPRIVRMAKKSNLGHFRDHRNFDDQDHFERQCSDDPNLTQSTGTLNELCEQADHNFFNTVMTSAKSVPNIANSEYYEDTNGDSKDVDSEEENVMNDSKDKKLEVDVGNDSGSSNVNSEIDVEEKDLSTEKLSNGNYEVDSSEEKINMKNIEENKLPMPSVRRLAEAFNKPTIIAPTPAPRTAKSIQRITRDV
ncbi:uncharacterized protein LOC122516629 isoform X1 [Polistes fuscatus]|uniref:uncharacterized protein LOC122516629 isoform X1 n=1 Tax=Polistes fuscatus TaxID=30207 RepID=UPI001CA9EBE6|nr:uncharacterized protein LOC122516629 isoform X1 [Polistes fuscatus]XP_043490530.1 uncharacterized protein LOC122516629 isoform X1 [Polistes fuscatus]XP_043490531.1 uncharacterized protein LOC122516629 isoform X1 [Polistes fuscatus]